MDALGEAERVWRGRCRRPGPPRDKERRERFSGSASEIPQSRCQSRNPTNCYNNCDSLAETFHKVCELSTVHCTSLPTLARSRPLAAWSFSSSQSAGDRTQSTSCGKNELIAQKSRCRSGEAGWFFPATSQWPGAAAASLGSALVFFTGLPM